MALALDADRGRPRRAGRHREPERGPVPDLLLRGQRVRPGPGPGQLPAERRGDPLHRRALGRVGAAGRPGVGRGACGTCTAKHRIVLDGAADAELFAPAPTGAQPAAWEPDEDATASINYTSGTTARPKGVQLTHRNCWLNAAIFGWHTAVTDRDVFMHTLPMFHCNGWGMPYAVTGHGPAAGHRAQDRRRGDPAPDRGARRDAAVRRPGGGGRDPERRRASAGRAGRADPRRRDGAHRGRRRAAAVQDHRAGRDRAGLGVHPDLRADRDRAAADHQPGAGRVGRPGARRAGPAPVPGRRPGGRRGRSGPTRTARCWPGPTTCSRATGSSRRSRPRRWRTAGSTPGTRATSRPASTWSSPTARRTSSSPAARTSARSRWRTASTSTRPWPRWRSSGCPTPGGARRSRRWSCCARRRRRPRPTEQELIEHCRARLAHYKCPTSVEFREALPRTATGKLQKFKLREPYWEGYDRRIN